jgi:hypothetical protein
MAPRIWIPLAAAVVLLGAAVAVTSRRGDHEEWSRVVGPLRALPPINAAELAGLGDFELPIDLASARRLVCDGGSSRRYPRLLQWRACLPMPPCCAP